MDDYHLLIPLSILNRSRRGTGAVCIELYFFIAYNYKETCKNFVNSCFGELMCRWDFLCRPLDKTDFVKSYTLNQPC